MLRSTLIILGTILLFRGCTPEAPSERPNILFFIADDMYPDMFNCLPEGKGKNLTPNLDRLSSEGTLMLKQYVVSPVCTPSRFNCLTGKYASRAVNSAFLAKTDHEEGQTVIQWNSFITPTDKTLPHYLKDLGYTTGMVGKNHVIEVPGLYRFPDFQSDPELPGIKEKLEENYLKVEEEIRACGFDFTGGVYHNNPDFIGLRKLAVQNLDWTTQAGLEFIEKNHEKPFFLYFATTVPHGPTEAERSWRADPRITARGILDQTPDVLPSRETLADRVEAAGLKGTGRENILWLDDALGALMDKLESHGILDNTIIFFFNDQGQKAKGTLYQGGVHNPSIIWKSGGFPCGKVCQAQVSNVDFAPTILEMAGIKEMPPDMDGIAFRDALYGNTIPSRESLYFELGYARAVIKGNYKYYAVRYPEYAENWTPLERAAELQRYNEGRDFRNMKIVNRDPEKPFSHLEVVPGGGEAENETYALLPGYFDADQLYDLVKDPQEQVNLVNDPDYREIFLEMKEVMKSYTSQLPGKFEL
ncbi:MAG: sulfatase-like hydrolase/transferase [Bacteroidales bacterium]